MKALDAAVERVADVAKNPVPLSIGLVVPLLLESAECCNQGLLGLQASWQAAVALLHLPVVVLHQFQKEGRMGLDLYGTDGQFHVVLAHVDKHAQRIALELPVQEMEV